uniref:Uncharacterized protein n=1 Tax=Siphoviridae sp. ctVsq1 TaxID=2827577 RepID=A0A8S5LKG7_9CAUD|nr:MAG TPA: hypothetical protein [Siphoviridae sp. ctVsq1]
MRTTGKKLTVTAARFLLFIKKTFPSCGSPYVFKNFSFWRFDSARPLRQGFLILPLQNISNTLYFSFPALLFLSGGWFFGGLKE